MPAQLSERPTAATEVTAPPWPAWPPTAAVNASTSLADVAAAVEPSVVSITVQGTGGEVEAQEWSCPRTG